MSKRIQHILTALGFTAALALAIFACSRLLEYKEAREKYTSFYDAETNFDVIFMGTSHAYGSVYPMELWREYGITSYNWGYNHCSVAENYHLMRECVKYTDVKLFVVDLYGLMEYENWDGVGNGKYRTDKVDEQHVQFDSLPLTSGKVEAVEDIFDDYDRRLDYLWNFILYHNRWQDLSQRDFAVEELPLMGATVYCGIGSHGPFTPTETGTVDLSSFVGYEYVLKMIAFCEENDIDLLFTYLPYPAKAASQQVANALEVALAEYESCRFWNMLDADYLLYPADLYTDDNHLNYIGACKTTSRLGSYILEHFDISSHTEDADAQACWGEYMARYWDYKCGLITQQSGFYEQLLLLYGEDFTAELRVRDGCDALTEDAIAADLLSQIGENVRIESVEELLFDQTSCDLQLTIRRSDSSDALQTRFFRYVDGSYTMVG